MPLSNIYVLYLHEFQENDAPQSHKFHPRAVIYRIPWNDDIHYIIEKLLSLQLQFLLTKQMKLNAKIAYLTHDKAHPPILRKRKSTHTNYCTDKSGNS